MLQITKWDEPDNVLCTAQNGWDAVFKLAQYLGKSPGDIRSYGSRKKPDGSVNHHLEVHLGYLQACDYYAAGIEETE